MDCIELSRFHDEIDKLENLAKDVHDRYEEAMENEDQELITYFYEAGIELRTAITYLGKAVDNLAAANFKLKKEDKNE